MFKSKSAFFLILLCGSLPLRTLFAAEPAANLAELPKSKLQLEVLKRDWGRDPFSLPEKNEAPVSGKAPIQLMGILTRGSRTIAIINKTFVRPGDTFQDYTVMAIESDRVILNKDGKETILRISDHGKKI